MYHLSLGLRCGLVHGVADLDVSFCVCQLNDYLEDRDAVLDEVQSKMPTSPSAGAGASDGSSAPGGRDSSLDVDVLVNKTDASATRAKTRGTLLTGLRDGSLEKAVAQMEADTSADTVAEEPKL